VSVPATRRTAPDWLLEPEVGLCPCGCIGRRKKTNFVTKTLNGASSVMRQALFSDDIAAQQGLLQAIDPRVKLLTMVGLLVVAATVRSTALLGAMYVGTLLLAAASRLSLRFFVKRVWLFIPIFTGIVVLPATLNVITPGEVVIPFGTWFGHELGVTKQGLEAAGLIVARVAVSISLVVLLTLTTPWNRLLSSLRALRVPKVFVLVLGMAYRYVFHLLSAVTDMYTARQARMIGKDTDVASGRGVVAASAGALFGKAHALSEEVYMAMVARGYTGNPRVLRPSRLRWLDGAWVLTCVAVAALVLGLNHAIA
jgi:cobalt ECF transporter T component CbiQ